MTKNVEDKALTEVTKYTKSEIKITKTKVNPPITNVI
jgi:hypothetical protein